jgi:hypothetical protein
MASQSNIQLDKNESLAFELLKEHPEILSSIAENGQVTISALHKFYYNLSEKLKFAQQRRNNDFIDVIPIQEKGN